jgi:hypothetical protein
MRVTIPKAEMIMNSWLTRKRRALKFTRVLIVLYLAAAIATSLARIIIPWWLDWIRVTGARASHNSFLAV